MSNTTLSLLRLGRRCPNSQSMRCRARHDKRSVATNLGGLGAAVASEIFANLYRACVVRRVFYGRLMPSTLMTRHRDNFARTNMVSEGLPATPVWRATLRRYWTMQWT